MSALLNVKISKEQLAAIENDLRLQRHVERYRYIRRYCYGSVIDIGCGVGYGSYLISQNPDVTHVTGIDKNAQSIYLANAEYSGPKTNFLIGEFTKTIGKSANIDVATIIEVLEHVKNPQALIQDCYDLQIDRIIATVPAYKTTHFNKHHSRDFTMPQFLALLHDGGYSTRHKGVDHSYPYPNDAMSANPQIFGNEVFLGIFQRMC